MQELYLTTDSKGIFPYDLESRANYLVRGTSLVLANFNRGITGTIMDALAKSYLNKSFYKTCAPKEAYDFMKKKWLKKF